MKCIKTTDGQIKRVSDTKAVDLVFEKKAVYASKGAFRKVNGKGAATTEAKAGSRNSSDKAKKADKAKLTEKNDKV